MRDVKERPSRSDLTTDTTGAYDGSCMVDPLSASSFPLKLSQQSLSQKSIRSIDPEHNSMKIKSHNEAQSGARIQLRTSHGTRTPDQSSMVSNLLWEIATMPAVHTYPHCYNHSIRRALQMMMMMHILISRTKVPLHLVQQHVIQQLKIAKTV